MYDTKISYRLADETRDVRPNLRPRSKSQDQHCNFWFKDYIPARKLIKLNLLHIKASWQLITYAK